MNTLYYGDNLKILREYIKDETVDLVYLDPPFNSNRNYNVLFKDESGKEADAQITAFEDTWHWTQSAEATYHELLMQADDVSKMIEAFRGFVGTNQMLAYLVMMTARLVELHRVLKPTGSLYLHCDPTASHYLKILLDTIFGAGNYRNEIIWKRSLGHNLATQRFDSITDTILFYSKSNRFLFKRQFEKISGDELREKFPYIEEGTGRRFNHQKLEKSSNAYSIGEKRIIQGKEITTNVGWIWTQQTFDERLAINPNLIYWTTNDRPRYKLYEDEYEGKLLSNLWNDMPAIASNAGESLGYPTQKPVALLERIVQASSNEGAVVLDPFCGCGTTIAAAQKLNRRWIGIDVTHLSIALQKYRLKDAFDLTEKKDYAVVGEPEDLNSAQQLALEDRYQFQWWALSLIKARPLGAASNSKQGKKGSDKGIDGVIVFTDDNSGKAKRVLVQVKSGKVKSGDIRDLVGTITREDAAIGVFITLENATRDMITEAVSAGFYHSQGWNRNYPKMQILTVEDLLNGKELQIPGDLRTFRQAEKIHTNKSAPQNAFDFE